MKIFAHFLFSLSVFSGFSASSQKPIFYIFIKSILLIKTSDGDLASGVTVADADGKAPDDIVVNGANNSSVTNSTHHEYPE